MTSSRARVVVTRRMPDAVTARLTGHYDACLNPDDAVWSQEELLRQVGGADALLCCPSDNINAEIISLLPESLRIIATYSAGTDHIDLDAARKCGLIVTNTPDVLTEATSEIAMLLIIATLRRAREAQHEIEGLKWQRWGPTHMLSPGLSGTRVGLIGMGRIAQATVTRLRPFGCDIYYWNRRRRTDQETGPGVTFMESLDALLATCQAISLHVPGGSTTHHLIGAREIGLMPKGATLINTSRGSLIDDRAVLRALQSGALSSVGLDVYNDEPDFNRDYLREPGAFLLPHIGSATQNTRCQMGLRAIENLEAFFSETPPRDRVV